MAIAGLKLRAPLKPLLNLARGRPVLGIFEITLRCNSACGYCDLPLNQGRYELDRGEIRRIFSALYADGLRVLLIQGGEPTVRRDLVDALDDLADIGFTLMLVTNGTRISLQLLECIKRHDIAVAVSLDTLDRERYRRIRGADQLAMVLRGMAALEQWSVRRYLTCIVTEQNRDDVHEVVAHARRHGFMPIVGAYHWDVERYGRADAALRYRRGEAAAVFDAVLERGEVPAGYFRDYVADTGAWLRGEALPACDAGRHSIAIDASGNVAPCLAMPFAGNLRESSLADILARFDRERIAACSAASTCNLMCSRVIGSALRSPGSFLRGLA